MQSVTQANLASIQDVPVRGKGDGSRFNILVCGASGIGKSSFIDVFLKKLDFEAQMEKVVQLRRNKFPEGDPCSKHANLRENEELFSYDNCTIRTTTEAFMTHYLDSSSKLKGVELTMTDSPGYGDKMDIYEWKQLIVEELKGRFQHYFDLTQAIEKDPEFSGDDQRIQREKKRVDDSRIHVILFFFSGHHNKDQEFLAIKEFQKFTNVIPVLAQGDCFNEKEMK